MVRARPLNLVALSFLLAALVAGIGPRRAHGVTEPLPRVSFVAAPGSSILVHGTYPKVDSPCLRPIQPLLHSRFPGTIEVGRDTDGTLFVIGVLPFEQYLEGIAEVPRTWPMEALKAQVVAARSYALAHLAYPDTTGDRLGYDLCVTTACQVYAGMRVSAGPYGSRWSRAVEATNGEVLLYKGKPADTLYFSTSKGSTVGNEKVFGTDPLPYLRPITENDDGASPLSHWQATLSYSDIGTFLDAAGVWGGEKVSSVSLSGSNVTVKGGGRTETMSVTDFRSRINYWAPCLDPDHYPTVDTDGIKLPQTVPSKWFSTANTGGSVVLTGRGWGHGVGMVQWGAYGKSLRGLSYDDILADYYGGLRPKAFAEPATIRVGIATGLQSVTIDPTGQVTVIGADGDPGPGPWLVTGKGRLHLKHGKRPPSYILRGKLLQAPAEAKFGHLMSASVSVPELSVARLVFRVEGPDVYVGAGVTTSPGTLMLSGKVPDLPPGTYGLQVEVTNGTDIMRSQAKQVLVTGGTVPTPSPSLSVSPSPSSTPALALAPSSDRGGWLAIVLGVAAVLLALAGLFWLRRRRSAPAPPAS